MNEWYDAESDREGGIGTMTSSREREVRAVFSCSETSKAYAMNTDQGAPHSAQPFSFVTLT